MAKKTDKNSRKDVVGNRSQAYNNDTAYNLTFDSANLSQPTINSFSSIAFSMLATFKGMVTNVNPGFDLTQLPPPNLPKPKELQVFPYSHDLDALTRHASFPASSRNSRPRPG
ncbi:MAG: hypothetical protein EAZ09_13120 [Oscillatoriales cyanobacterium]|nr:MAG: hypothetical protein EAZ09_13120 [Oscillatoriales cyanobacterium]